MEVEEAAPRFHFSARSQVSSPGLLQLLSMLLSGRAMVEPDTTLFDQKPTDLKPGACQPFENISDGGQ